jgi:hypothetical protein
MKNLIIIGSAFVAITAVSVFADKYSANAHDQAILVSAKINADTTPKKKDTASTAYTVFVNDTTPKKKDTTLFATNAVSYDTTPKKKDTALFAMNKVDKRIAIY